jgi:U2 small nuclear ribonucleoprotein A'
MRLSAEIIQTAEQRTNPLGERELILRSLAIPTIEHLSVTRDAFDSIDLSNNHICKLENFPRLQRLSALHLGGNGVEVVDGRNLRKNLPELKTLVLSGCSVRGWNVLGELGVGCPKLEVLSLVGNPVTSKFFAAYYNYRLIVDCVLADWCCD